MATMAEVVDEAEARWAALAYSPTPAEFVPSHGEYIAAAVAAHLASPEAIERAHGPIWLGMKVQCADRNICATADVCGCYIRAYGAASAAIRAALGEHEGVGRG